VTGGHASKPGLTGDRKLHFVGLLDYFRGLQNFEANHATVVAEIGNHPRTNLVTFLYARVPQRNGQDVRFFCRIQLSCGTSYFANFDVL
jgi:hypothetical protein